MRGFPVLNLQLLELKLFGLFKVPKSILRGDRMEKKKVKQSKKQITMKPTRIYLKTFEKVDAFIKNANKNKVGKGKINLALVFDLLAEELSEKHVKMLQSRTLKNSDRQEIIQQKYFEVFNTNSKEEFIGFTLTPEYPEFVKEHQHLVTL